jgi:branched-chain amino acid transport system substrate-binding protein
LKAALPLSEMISYFGLQKMKKSLLLASMFMTLASPAYADISIGFIAPLTGQSAIFGEQLRRGAEQAVTDINAAGGIKGEKLKLEEADDACDPKQAVAATNKLISQGIKFIVGHLCSGSAIPSSKIDMDEGVMMITPGASNPKLTDEAKDVIFRTYGRDDREGAFVGTFLLTHFQGKRIAIINDSSAYGLGLAQEVKKALNAGGVNEIMFDTYTPGERDYAPVISKLKQAGAQVVVIGGYHTETGLIARQIQEQKANIQIVGGNALMTDELWKIAGASAEGLLMSYTSDPRKNPEAKDVIAVMRKSGFEPEGFTLNSYAAVQVVAEGIKRAGTSPTKAAAALRQSPPVGTVLGPLSYDAKGDIENVKYAMYRWHDGTYAEVAP